MTSREAGKKNHFTSNSKELLWTATKRKVKDHASVRALTP